MVTEIIVLLESHRNPDNAAPMARYMKNQFPFLGIKKPQLELLLKPYLIAYKVESKIDWELIRQLWGQPEREYQYAALLILQVQKKVLEWKDLPQIEFLIQERSWWDTVDVLATHMLAAIGLKFERQMKATMLNWSKSDNFWIVRSALLYQLKYKTLTDTEVLSIIILNCADSKEFFIRKAIGWVLREYSKTNPEWVANFIDQNFLSKLSVREGRRYLT
jgi:3-methyladenine DNA glycosylase AlkD